METKETRECARCHEHLPLEDFHLRTQEVRGHPKQAWCKECFKEYYKEYHREVHNPAADDGRTYVEIGRIEPAEDFEKKDALRRAAFFKRSA